MGYTIVAGFDWQGTQKLHQLMQPFRANKIPFGRNCDRAAANEAMDYHMTMFHWPKTMDSVYLPRLQHFSSFPCQLLIDGVHMMMAEEGSWLLYFSVQPTESYRKLAGHLEASIRDVTSSFFHITLAVSQDVNEIQRIFSHIRENTAFPFVLNTDRLDLYHIWKPTLKVQSF